MTPLLAAEFFKLRKRPACWITLLIGAIVVGFLYLMLGAIVLSGLDTQASTESLEDLSEAIALRHSMIFGFGVTQFVTSTLGIILMAMVITSEYGWRTIMTTVNWTGERGKLLVARIVAVLGMLAFAVVLGWAVAALGSATIQLADGTLTSEGLGMGFAGSVLAGWARTWLTVVTYAMLAAALATVSRNLALAIGIALVVRFIEPVGVQVLDLLPNTIASFKHLTISANVDALLYANGVIDSDSASDRDLPSTLQAALYLVGFCLMSGAISVYAFARRDIDV